MVVNFAAMAAVACLLIAANPNDPCPLGYECSVLAFGALCDGENDDTAGIQDTIDYADSRFNGDHEHVPDVMIEGGCQISAPIEFNVARIRGRGPGITNVNWIGPQGVGAMFTRANAGGTSVGGISNLTLRGTQGNWPEHCIDLGPHVVDRRFTIENIHCRATTSHGIKMMNPINAGFYNMRFDKVGGCAIHVTYLRKAHLVTFALDRFTMDTRAQNSPGLACLESGEDGGPANAGTVHISDGRIEIQDGAVTVPFGIVHVIKTKKTYDFAHGIHIEDVTLQDVGNYPGSSDQTAVIQLSMDTSGREGFLIENVRAGVKELLGGNWDSRTPPFELSDGGTVQFASYTLPLNTDKIALRARNPEIEILWSTARGDTEPRFLVTPTSIEFGNGQDDRDAGFFYQAGGGFTVEAPAGFNATGGISPGNGPIAALPAGPAPGTSFFVDDSVDGSCINGGGSLEALCVYYPSQGWVAK